MKKFIVGSLVGAILLFGWQAVAHMFMHHHDGSYMAAANDAPLLAAMQENLKTEGRYFVPALKLNATAEEQEAFGEAMKGKPWAYITYHPSFSDNMAMSAMRSFVTAFLCVLIFIAILGKAPGTFGQIFLKSLGLGFLIFMFVWYNENIWMQTPWSVIKGELIDDLAGWGLCGLWLGWWLNKTGKANRNLYGQMS